MKKVIKNLLILLSLGSSINAFAACDYEINFSNKTVPWSESGNIIPVKISVNRSSSGSNCFTYFITMTKGSSGSYLRRLQGSSGATLNYNLYTNSSATSIIKELQDFSSLSDVILGFLGRSRSAEQTFYTKIERPSGTNVPLTRGGLYSDTVSINIYSGFPKFGSRLEQTKSFTLSTFIPKAVDISLVERGADFDINDTEHTLDFGTLTEGKTLGFDLRIQTNAGYKVFMESFNRGVLKHESKNKTVKYDLKIDGNKKNLKRRGRVQVLDYSGTTEAGGNVHNVDVTIGKVGNAAHGLYSDYITITAMTKE